MFGASGGGGNAGCIGCVCNDGTKGRGITSPADAIPMGDNFDIDYVAHEVGHQLGANHSFSHANEGSGQNKEVGSGITVMGYAGITGCDVAPHSIDTFHATNIDQIQTNLASKACPITTVMTANATPVVAPVGNVTIPISTPFELTGSATDANADPLTYQWEQNDVATTFGANSVASPTKATGPNWLSFVPTTSPTRTFPTVVDAPGRPVRHAAVAGRRRGREHRSPELGLADPELPPDGPRQPSLRLAGSSGRGTDPVHRRDGDRERRLRSVRGHRANTGVTWDTLSTQTVTWNVANTTAAPVSCPLVNISLSTDSGATFPTVLLAGTPNDGTESVIVPGTTTPNARVKVKCANNIFFDISNANFSIVVPVELTGFEVQ